jgi:hypothetical protein
MSRNQASVPLHQFGFFHGGTLTFIWVCFLVFFRVRIYVCGISAVSRSLFRLLIWAINFTGLCLFECLVMLVIQFAVKSYRDKFQINTRWLTYLCLYLLPCFLCTLSCSYHLQFNRKYMTASRTFDSVWSKTSVATPRKYLNFYASCFEQNLYAVSLSRRTCPLS